MSLSLASVSLFLSEDCSVPLDCPLHPTTVSSVRHNKSRARTRFLLMDITHQFPPLFVCFTQKSIAQHRFTVKRKFIIVDIFLTFVYIRMAISEGGKLSVIGDIGSFHLRCVFVETDIFPHRRNLILNVCNFTAVFIREVLVGVA